MRRRIRRPRAAPPRTVVDQLRGEVGAIAWEVHDVGAIVRLLVEHASPDARAAILEHLNRLDKPAPEDHA